MNKIDIIGKSLSVNISLYDKIEKDEIGRILSFNNPYDSIKLPKNKKLNNINIVMDINIVGSTIKEKDIFNLGLDNLELKLIIKRCSTNKEDRLSLDLGTIIADLSSADTIKGSGFPKTLDYRRIITIDQIDFSVFDNPLGNYVLYLKTELEDFDTIVVKGVTEFTLF